MVKKAVLKEIRKGIVIALNVGIIAIVWRYLLFFDKRNLHSTPQRRV